MTRRVTTLVLCAITAMSCAFSTPADPADAKPDTKFPAAAEQAQQADADARQRLDRHLPDVTFNETALGDALDHLRDATGANVFVNWRALEKIHVTKQTAVTVRAKDVSLAHTLDLVLDNAAGQKRSLAWVIDDGVVTISTAEDLQRNTVTKVYDVRFLIANGAQPAADGDARQRRADTVVKMLTDSVDPKSWRDHGGSAGAVKELSGQLIVTQTDDNHRAIANLLDQLKTLNEGR